MRLPLEVPRCMGMIGGCSPCPLGLLGERVGEKEGVQVLLLARTWKPAPFPLLLVLLEQGRQKCLREGWFVLLTGVLEDWWLPSDCSTLPTSLWMSVLHPIPRALLFYLTLCPLPILYSFIEFS